MESASADALAGLRKAVGNFSVGGVHVQDMGMESHPVNEGRKHHLVFKNFGPVGEIQIGGNDDAGSFGPFRNDLKEQFGLCPIESKVGEFINNEKIQPGQRLVSK